jgi:hypothetical protein
MGGNDGGACPGRLSGSAVSVKSIFEAFDTWSQSIHQFSTGRPSTVTFCTYSFSGAPGAGKTAHLGSRHSIKY